MGYRPEDQALEKPLNDILKGIEAFESAAKKRIESDEWSSEHIIELIDMRSELFALMIKAEKMKRSNW